MLKRGGGEGASSSEQASEAEEKVVEGTDDSEKEALLAQCIARAAVRAHARMEVSMVGAAGSGAWGMGHSGGDTRGDGCQAPIATSIHSYPYTHPHPCSWRCRVALGRRQWRSEGWMGILQGGSAGYLKR